MMRRVGVLVLLVMAAVPAAQAGIVVGEVLANPETDWNGDGAVDFKTDEWVEVLNTGGEAVDLALFWLRDGTGDAPHLNLSGTLAPGGVAVFYGSDAVAWQLANGQSSTGLSLNNTGDTVQVLIADPDAPGSYLVADSRTYLPHEGDSDRASGLLADGTWALFDGLNPYCCDDPPPGTGCFPSPGVANTCDPETPVEAATWGELKASFDPVTAR